MANKKDTKKSKYFKLKLFNSRIYKIQNKVINECINLDEMLQKRVSNKDDLLNDYEIEIEVSFVLKKNHKKYKKNSDNIITAIYEYVKGISKKDIYENWRFGRSNHNESTFRESAPMFGDYHCWWFHCLYDHNHLSFKKILQISKIYTDVKVTYQFMD
jgi:hypothetical protein